MGRPEGVSAYVMPNPRKITCSVQRIRHCFIPSVRDKRRSFLSLIVAIVVLEVIDSPIRERLGVLFLNSQGCSCRPLDSVTAEGALIMVSYRIGRKCISQQMNTFPTRVPTHESDRQPQGFHLGIW